MLSSTELPKIGQKVRLVYTDDSYTELRSGAIGTVFYIDDLNTVMVDWEDGSTLGLIPGIDIYEIID